MPKPVLKLANCYLPLTKPAPDAAKPKARDSGDGTTSRASHSLRRTLIETNVLPASQGSAQFELGHTKVLCQVAAPLYANDVAKIQQSPALSVDKGTLWCQVKYIPHVSYPPARWLASAARPLDDHASHQQRWQVPLARREADMSARVQSALAASVPLQQYQKCCIHVLVTVLQDDGNAMSAAIAAASLALAQAQVEVYDLVTACRVAVHNDPKEKVTILYADPDLDEEEHADAVVTLAMLPNWKEVSLLEQSGRLSHEQANQAIELCRDGCRTIHRFLRDHLIERVNEEKQ